VSRFIRCNPKGRVCWIPRYFGPFFFSIQFEPRDAWVGMYWKRGAEYEPEEDAWTFYVCLAPFFPLIVSVSR
jgi:hypothetical protein